MSCIQITDKSATYSGNSSPFYNSFNNFCSSRLGIKARGRDTAFVDGEVQIKINNFTTLYKDASYTTFERGSDYTFGGGIRIRF